MTDIDKAHRLAEAWTPDLGRMQYLTKDRQYRNYGDAVGLLRQALPGLWDAIADDKVPSVEIRCSRLHHIKDAGLALGGQGNPHLRQLKRGRGTITSGWDGLTPSSPDADPLGGPRPRLACARCDYDNPWGQGKLLVLYMHALANGAPYNLVLP